MKITEPKTPYVRYNALTDTVEGGTSPEIFVSLISCLCFYFPFPISYFPSLSLGQTFHNSTLTTCHRPCTRSRQQVALAQITLDLPLGARPFRAQAGVLALAGAARAVGAPAGAPALIFQGMRRVSL